MIEVESDKSYFVRELGPLRVSIDEDRITIGKRRQIAQRIIAIKKDHIKDLKAHPMRDDESLEAWEARVKEEKAVTRTAEALRKPGESTDAYIHRLLDPDPDLEDLTLIKDLLRFILEEFDDPKKLTDKVFDNLPLGPTMDFIKEVLRKVRVNVEAIFPGTFGRQGVSGVGEPSPEAAQPA